MQFRHRSSLPALALSLMAFIPTALSQITLNVPIKGGVSKEVEDLWYIIDEDKQRLKEKYKVQDKNVKLGVVANHNDLELAITILPSEGILFPELNPDIHTFQLVLPSDAKISKIEQEAVVEGKPIKLKDNPELRIATKIVSTAAKEGFDTIIEEIPIIDFFHRNKTTPSSNELNLENYIVHHIPNFTTNNPLKREYESITLRAILAKKIENDCYAVINTRIKTKDGIGQLEKQVLFEKTTLHERSLSDFLFSERDYLEGYSLLDIEKLSVKIQPKNPGQNKSLADELVVDDCWTAYYTRNEEQILAINIFKASTKNQVEKIKKEFTAENTNNLAFLSSPPNYISVCLPMGEIETEKERLTKIVDKVRLSNNLKLEWKNSLIKSTNSAPSENTSNRVLNLNSEDCFTESEIPSGFSLYKIKPSEYNLIGDKNPDYSDGLKAKYQGTEAFASYYGRDGAVFGVYNVKYNDMDKLRKSVRSFGNKYASLEMWGNACIIMYVETVFGNFTAEDKRSIHKSCEKLGKRKDWDNIWTKQ